MNKDAKGILILIAVLVALSLMSSCKDRPDQHINYDKQGNIIPAPDSVSYAMYRGKFTNGPNEAQLTPIYIPATDTIFLVGDTVSVALNGTYSSGSSFKARIDKFVRVVKFAKDE